MEQMLKKELDNQKNIKISLTEEQYQINHDLSRRNNFMYQYAKIYQKFCKEKK